MKYSSRLAVLFLVAMLSGCSNRVGAYKQLVTRNASTTAVVTSKDCGDHGRKNYAFSVEGKVFTGHAYWLGIPCEKTPIGHALTVYYDPLDPTVNSGLTPPEAYAYHRDQLLNKIYVGLFVVAAFVVGRFRKGR